MTDFEQSIISGLKDAMQRLQTDMRAELKAQGHVLTGRLSESLEYEIEVQGDKVVAAMVFSFDQFKIYVESAVTFNCTRI